MDGTGTLFVVATPIGNLGDISPRALDTLRSVAGICAEDTRRSGQLLSHFGISTPLLALHEHNEDAIAARIVVRLQAGESLALVSDAGTPLVSDPGFRLVQAARAAGVKVSPVPGASALIAALSVAGLPSDRFAFEGFLPAKGNARRERLQGLAAESRTLIFCLKKLDKNGDGKITPEELRLQRPEGGPGGQDGQQGRRPQRPPGNN